MRNHTLITGLLLLGLTLLGGCASGAGSPSRGGGGEDPFPPDTQEGDLLLDGELRVESVQRPAGPGGEAVFKVRNLSGRPLKYLTGTVLFFYDPPTGGIAKIASEASIEGFDIFTDETLEIRGTYTMQEDLRRMQLRVERIETVPGITFLAGGLRCVDVVNDIPTPEPRVVFKVQNVAGRPLENVRFKVVLLHRTKTEEVLEESRWQAVPGGTVPAGGILDLEPQFREDLSEFGFPLAVLQIKQSG